MADPISAGVAAVDIVPNMRLFVSRLTAEVTKSTSKLQRASLVAGVAIAAGVVKALDGSVKAARATQVAQAKLKTVADAVGISWEKQGKAIKRTISGYTDLGFKVPETTSAYADLLQVTGNAAEATRGLNLAMDISRARHIPLAKAALLVSKVQNGNVGLLKRYGIQVAKGATASEALAAAQAKFAGQAEAFAKTNEGAQERFHAKVEEIRASIGGLLLPVMTKATNIGIRFFDFLEQHKTTAKIIAAAVGVLTVSMIAYGVATGIAALVTSALFLPILAIVGGIALLAAGLTLAWKRSETFRDVVTGVIDFVRDHWRGFVNFFGGIFARTIGQVIAHWGELESAVSAVFANIKGFAVGAINFVIDRINDLIGAIDSLIGAFNALPGPDIGKVGKIGHVGASPGGDYEGRHADGGYIAPGKWGWVGERGVEAAFGGRTGLSIVPNHALVPHGLEGLRLKGTMRIANWKEGLAEFDGRIVGAIEEAQASATRLERMRR